jgi:hypothetical protein
LQTQLPCSFNEISQTLTTSQTFFPPILTFPQNNTPPETQESLHHYTAFVRVSAKIVCCTKQQKHFLYTFLLFDVLFIPIHLFIFFVFVLSPMLFFREVLNEKFDVVTSGRGEKEKSNDNSFAIITTAHRENHYIVSLL